MVADTRQHFPALRGEMGSRTYWVTIWPWGFVRTMIEFAQDLPDYTSLPPAEKVQREINSSRVQKQIVPYILNNDDRFFGALIVEGRGTKPEFQPLEGYSGYGTLTMSGDYVLFALDGQHRLAAIKESCLSHTELASELQTVILVWHESTLKTRKLFTHVNKYARGTTTAQNILLDDEDLYAEIARRLEREIPIFKERVNWKGNSLSTTTSNVTTAPVLRLSASIWLDEYNIRSTLVEIPEAQVDSYYDEVKGIWEKIIPELKPLQEVLTGAAEMRQLRDRYIIHTPVGQQSMIHAVQMARQRYVPIEDIATRLGEIDWDKASPLWNRIIYNPDLKRMITGRENWSAMGDILGFILGGVYDSDEQGELLNMLKAHQVGATSLPSQLG